MRSIVLIAHNIRSAHNVGSLLRTADGLGVSTVYTTGYTPFPLQKNDSRLPHLARKINNQITKTSLGAEKTVKSEHVEDPLQLFESLRVQGYLICALEQARGSADVTKFQPSDKVALVLGREVEGLEANILSQCDKVLEIPMFGRKESFNVASAAAMALFHIRFAK